VHGPDPHAPARSVALLLALLSLGLQGCSALGHAERPRQVVRGPIPSRNLQPIATTLLAFRPRRAAIQPAGEWQTRASAGYASIEEIPVTDGDRISLDAELGRLELGARVGIGGLADLELALPFLYTTSGFLDDMVEWFHETFALPDGGRDMYPNDQFDVELVSDGQQLYQLDEDRFGIEDIPIFVAFRLREEDEAGPGLAARLGVELPTGDQDAGFGNGAVDWGLGLSLERSWGRWTLFSGADYVFAGQPDAFEASDRHRLEDFLDLQLGVEYRWSNRVSLLMQTTWTERQIDTLPYEEVAREVFDLGVGVGVDTGRRSSLTASIHEDLVSATGADFTALVSWRADW
jgi:hypothetical protein